MARLNLSSGRDGASGSPESKVALSRVLAFTAPSLPLAALGLPLVVQLPSHYAAHLGVHVGVVGLIFMLARIGDIFVDLGIGIAMDRTRTPIGRFSPWLLASAPVIAAGAWYLFMAEPGVGPAYLALSLMLTYVGFSMGSLSQMSLGATLSDNYHERSRVFAFWQSGNVVGMLLVLAIPVLVDKMGGTPAEGVRDMGWFIIGLIPLTVLIAAAFAREERPKARPEPVRLSDLKALAGSSACRRLLAADLILMFGSGVTGGLFLFYFAAIKGFGGQAPALMLIYFIAGLIGTPIWTFIARRAGKHVSLICACLYAALTQPLIHFLPVGNFGIAAAAMAGAGLVYAAGAYLLRAMMADIGDEVLLVSGKDRTGLLYAMVTLTGKAGYAFAVGATFVGLAMFGYDATAGAANSAGALLGLTVLFIGLPVVCNLAGAGLLWRYPIDAARTREIQEAITDRRGGAAA